MSATIDLSGKTAVVTGGARGIGRAISESLHAAGANVVVFGRNIEAAKAFADELSSEQAQVVAIQADVGDPEAVNAAAAQVKDLFGTPAILVNNAGITHDGPLMRMSDEAWQSVIDVNLRGVFNCLRAFSRGMLKARTGSIINVASVVALSGNPGQANYCAAKAGVIGLTKAAAREFAARGIRVNALAPGLIETDMTADLPEAARDAMVSAIPLGRVGTPQDVAGAVLFLASDLSAYITGQVLPVAGGMVMNG